MSWMQIEKNVDNLFPQVSADLKNNPDDSLQEMVNFDHPEDSAITTDLVFRYFHLLGKEKIPIQFQPTILQTFFPFFFLEKVKMNYVKAIRPWPLMSVPYQREKTHHKLVLQDFQEIMPPEDLRSFKLILGLVVMDINGELPHFSLLVVDNVRKQVKHFCSLQVKRWQFLKMHLQPQFTSVLPTLHDQMAT